MYGRPDRLIADQMRVSVGQFNGSVLSLPSPGRPSTHAHDPVHQPYLARPSLPARLLPPIAWADQEEVIAE